jgi:hypothetical protein
VPLALIVLALVPGVALLFTARRRGVAVPLMRTAADAAMTFLVGALVGGAGLRAGMRFVALTDGSPGTEFTPAGTALIFIVALLASIPFGVVAVGLDRLSPRQLGRSAARMAMTTFVLVGLPFLVLFAEIRQRGVPWLNRPMFGLTFVAWGAAMGWMAARRSPLVGRRAAALDSRRATVAEAPDG